MNLGAGMISHVDVDQWVVKICSQREKPVGIQKGKERLLASESD